VALRSGVSFFLPSFAVPAGVFFRPDDRVPEVPLSPSAFTSDRRLRLRWVIESQRAAVFGEEIAERLVSEFLKVGHGIPGEQVYGRPRFLIELHALARHRPTLLAVNQFQNIPL
jgi:hypothetical protein